MRRVLRSKRRVSADGRRQEVSENMRRMEIKGTKNKEIRTWGVRKILREKGQDIRRRRKTEKHQRAETTVESLHQIRIIFSADPRGSFFLSLVTILHHPGETYYMGERKGSLWPTPMVKSKEEASNEKSRYWGRRLHTHSTLKAQSLNEKQLGSHVFCGQNNQPRFRAHLFQPTRGRTIHPVAKVTPNSIKTKSFQRFQKKILNFLNSAPYHRSEIPANRRSKSVALIRCGNSRERRPIASEQSINSYWLIKLLLILCLKRRAEAGNIFLHPNIPLRNLNFFVFFFQKQLFFTLDIHPCQKKSLASHSFSFFIIQEEPRDERVWRIFQQFLIALNEYKQKNNNE